jgi:hypothetical protein
MTRTDPVAVGVLGGAYYLLIERHRTGVLAEHRADTAKSVAAPVTAGTRGITPDTAG